MSIALTPADRIRRAIVRQHPFFQRGRRFPDPLVKLMHDTYRHHGSLHKAGKIFGRTGACLNKMFRRRSLPVKDARKVRAFEFNGVRFGKVGRNWKALTKPRITLQKAVWQQRHGPVPAGKSIHFANGDRSDFTKDNLVALTAAEAFLFHARSRSPRGKRKPPPG